MSVIVAGFPEDSDVNGAIELLSNGLQRAGVVVEHCSGDQVFALRDKAVILFYNTAEAAVSKALRQGTSPAAALNEWRAITEKCLAGYRSNRRGIILLDAGAFLAAPQAFMGAFGARFDWTLGDIASAPVSQTVLDGDQMDILLVIAAVAVSHDPLARRLDGELQAGSLWPDAGAGSVERRADPEAAFATYQENQSRQAAASKEKQQAAQQEKTLLLQQLANTQIELEKMALALEDQKTAAQRDKAALLQQLAAAQGDLEKTTQTLAEQKTTAQQDKAALLQQLMGTQGELEGFAISADDQKTAAQREKTLLMQQLSNTQAELESYFNELQTAKKQHSAFETELKTVYEKAQRHKAEAEHLRETLDQLQSRATQSEQQLQDALQRIDVLQGDIALRDGEIAALHNSTSWKITSPIRGVGDTLKGTRKRD